MNLGGSPDGDRIGSHEATPNDNTGGGLGNWHDMGSCCDEGGLAGHDCNGFSLRTTSEAQGAWDAVFGTDSEGTVTGIEREEECNDANWASSSGLNYDYAIFFGQ